MKKQLWRVRIGLRRGKRVGTVQRLVKSQWRTIGWLNNVSFARRVVGSLNKE
jgi:hypothetical protein